MQWVADWPLAIHITIYVGLLICILVSLVISEIESKSNPGERMELSSAAGWTLATLSVSLLGILQVYIMYNFASPRFEAEMATGPVLGCLLAGRWFKISRR